MCVLGEATIGDVERDCHDAVEPGLQEAMSAKCRNVQTVHPTYEGICQSLLALVHLPCLGGEKRNQWLTKSKLSVTTHLVADSLVVGADSLDGHDLFVRVEKARVERRVRKKEEEEHSYRHRECAEEDEQSLPRSDGKVAAEVGLGEPVGECRTENLAESVAGEPDACHRKGRVRTAESRRGLQTRMQKDNEPVRVPCSDLRYH